MAKHKKYVHRKRNKPGTEAGTLVPTQDSMQPPMQIVAFNADQYVEVTLQSVDEINDYYKKWPVIWVNVDGVSNAETVQKIGEIFQLHPLALEDTVNVHQRPKTEDYETHLYTVCRMANDISGGDELDLEQISIFLGPDFVLSFQEAPGDCWNIIRDRIRRGTGNRILTSGADYLAYVMLDAVIDGFFPLLEKFGDRIDAMEDEVLNNPGNDVMVDIQMAKRYMHTIRHSIWPMRESINQLMSHERLGPRLI